MPYYSPQPYDQAQRRGPIYAEDGQAMPDFAMLREQTRESGRSAQDAMRRAGELSTKNYERLGEDAREMVQAPIRGYEAYETAKERGQEQQSKQQEMAMRQKQMDLQQQQITQMERANRLGEEFDATERAQALRGREAETALAEQGARKGEMELGQLEKWNSPGSAAKFFPQHADLIKENPDMSAADFLKVNAGNMDFQTYKAAKQSYDQAAQEFPLSSSTSRPRSRRSGRPPSRAITRSTASSSWTKPGILPPWPSSAWLPSARPWKTVCAKIRR